MEKIKPLIQTICEKFNVAEVGSFELTGTYANLRGIKSDKIVYLCISLKNQEILKVGQTTNVITRLPPYKRRDESRNPIYVVLFEAKSWSHQDLVEKQIRGLLDSMNFDLPWDKTARRKGPHGTT